MKKLLFVVFAALFFVQNAEAKLVGITSDYRKNFDGKNDFAKTSFYAIRDNYVSSFQKVCKKYDVTVVIIPLDKSMIKNYAETFDGVVFSGNYYDVNPHLYGEKKLNETVNIDEYKNSFESALFKKFYKTNKPIFGICGGYQTINVALGGKLIQDIPTQIKESKINHAAGGEKLSHEVNILEESGVFAEAISKAGKGKNISVNSSHHQAISKIAKELEVTAVAPDGVIEGYKAKNHPFLIGVQWHPEYELSEFDVNLMDEFCRAVAR